MGLKQHIDKARQFVLQQLWTRDLGDFHRSRKLLHKTLRIFTLALYEYGASKCALRAAALTLVFTFSLAPALALGFSVAKGFGMQEKIRPIIYNWLGVDGAPVAQNGEAAPAEPPEGAQPIRKVLDAILGYVEKTDAEALGVAGLLVILYAAYTVLNAVEATMNEIWGVRKRRPLLRKVIDYLAVLFVLPLMLLVAALVLTLLKSETAMNLVLSHLPGPVIALLGGTVALLFSAAGFAFLYFFFPNTRVPLLSAATGAIVTAVLWSFSQYLYVQLQVGVAKYNAIYGAFAAIPIFLFWLYVSWSIVLFGAEISYAHASQSEFEYGGLVFAPSAAYRSRLAMGIMLMAGRAFQNEEPAPTVADCSRKLAAPVRTVRDVISDLSQAHLLCEISTDGLPAYEPYAPLERITLGRIMDAVNEAGETPALSIKALGAFGVNSIYNDRLKALDTFRATTLLEMLSTNGLSSSTAVSK